ncbi:hypothetical protein AB0L68_30825 [Streptomyces sp. NPDC052164]|uniref:DUF6415 family natural product biosynthesis protein n=1 Tax=Streptomyces sp. NPDC052164 TaxID=3155529 RepID=UPI003446D6D6
MRPNTHTVLYDPHGYFGAELPRDRAPCERLITAVLSWTDLTTLTVHDYEQIALQLTGHARAVATDVRHHADLLDDDTGPRALAEIILAEAQRRLDTSHQGTLCCVQNRARLVRALYERLDREDLLPGRGEPVAVVGRLADVHPEEDAHVFNVEHRTLPEVLTVPASALAPCSRIHVMQTCRPRLCPALRRTGRWPGLSSASPTAPHGPGDTTPQVMPSTEGTQSYRARRPAAPLQDREKHNGGGLAPNRDWPRPQPAHSLVLQL